MTNARSQQSFDRVRPRTTDAPAAAASTADREGKQALFSEPAAPPPLGSVALECERCSTRTVVTWGRALRLALPSVPTALPGQGVRNYMRCPACAQRAWLSVSLRG